MTKVKKEICEQVAKVVVFAHKQNEAVIVEITAGKNEKVVATVVANRIAKDLEILSIRKLVCDKIEHIQNNFMNWRIHGQEK